MSFTDKLRAVTDLTRYREYLGVTTASTTLGVLAWSNPTPDAISTVITLLLMHLCTFAFAFMINDIEDAGDDARDPHKSKRNPISAGRLTRSQGLISAWGFALMSALFGALLGGAASVTNMLALAFAFAYSWKKVRLKSIPFVDVVSHALFLGTLQYVATVLSQDVLSIAIVVWGAVSIFSVSVIGDLHNEIRDFTVDKISGIRNTAQMFGMDRYARWIPLLQAVTVSSCVLYFLSHTSLTILATTGIFIILTLATLTIAHLVRGTVSFSYHHRELLLASLGLLVIAVKMYVR